MLKINRRSKKLVFIFYIIISLIPVTTTYSRSLINNKVKNLIYILEKYHVNEKVLNDDDFIEIKKIFLNKLDPYRLYFSDSDINELIQVKLVRKDFYNGNDTSFLDKTKKIYTQNAVNVLKILKEISESSLDYDKQESVKISYTDEIDYVDESRSLSQRWEKWLKYQILNQLHKQAVEKNINLDSIEELLKEEPAIRKQIENSTRERVAFFVDNKDNANNYLDSFFLNTIAAYFDPHSNYLSYNDKAFFESSLSRHSLSFGLQLKKLSNGEFHVEYLTPGGPAWKSNKINKEDIIEEIIFDNGNTFTVKPVNLNQSEIDYLLNNPEYKNIRLKVRKKSGTAADVTLYLEELAVDNNNISSFILENKSKIGYIYLPAFYTEWDQEYASGCASDVAKELIKQKKEDIKGLILDLRNNGGGSIIEALSLAGIFINEGPLTIQRSRMTKPQVLKDINRGIIYDGPLIIMVNQYSASASEILASALKDYNRALIIGSPTFGKASGQIILPLIDDIDRSINKPLNNFNKVRDFVKITTNQYYNLFGVSYQKNGVVPDILIPDVTNLIPYSEKNYPNALSSELIPKKINFTQNDSLPLDSLKNSSLKRIQNNNQFNKLNEIREKLLKYYQNGYIQDLNIQEFFNEMKVRDKLWDDFEEASKNKSKKIMVKNNLYDLEVLKLDDNKKILNDDLVKQIQNDIYIEEAFNIMMDLINK